MQEGKKQKFYYVYKTTNLFNKKIYVGAHETNNMDDGYFGSGAILIKAFNKYGIDNFKREILYLLNNREEMYLKEAEIVNEEFIARSDTYNIELGGHGGGNQCSEETKRKHSLALIGRKHSEESKKKMSIAQSNKSLEHRAKISASKMGIPRSLETIAKVSASLTGRINGPHTSESIAKMSAAKMGHEVSVETKQKLATANIGKKWSEETRAKRAATALRKRLEREAVKAQEDVIKIPKERVITDEYRKKMSEIKMGHEVTEETRAKCSAVNLGRKHTEESRMNMSEAHMGKQAGVDNPFYGKHHSEESIQKMREAHRGKPCSEETKAKKRLIAAQKKLEREALQQQEQNSVVYK